jgi:hypothetical protein
MFATTASWPSFEPLEIRHQGATFAFQDPSQRGYSNPTQLAVQELRHLTHDQQPSIVLSMGAGLLNIINPDPRSSPDVAEAWLKQLQDVVNDTQAVHRSVSDVLKR